MVIRGCRGVPDFCLRLLDIELAVRQPQTDFLIFSDVPQAFQKLRRIGKLEADLYQFSNNFEDVLSLDRIGSQPLFYQPHLSMNALTGVDLPALRERSQMRHEALRFVRTLQHIGLSCTIASPEHAFEKIILQLSA